MEGLGRRLLAEVEECSLEELLRDLRRLHSTHVHLPPSGPTRLGLPALDALWASHRPSTRLELTGPGALPLLYHIVSSVVSASRNGTIVVLDLDRRFDVSRLSCAAEELKHVHVMRVQKERLREAVAGVEDYFLRGKHASMGREWVGTCVSGGLGGDVCVDWRGWLRVESEVVSVDGFGVGMSVEEAMEERDRRQELVEGKMWRAVSKWGEYRFKES